MPRRNQSNSDETEETNYEVIDIHNWNIQEHTCGVAKNNKSGQGKTAVISYRGKRFYLKTPKMYCPFGASKPKLKPGETPKENETWSIQMAFDNNNDCQAFQQKATEFDQFMIDQGVVPDNCVNWLGASKTKPFSREVVEIKYSPMVKYSKRDGEIQTQYPPFIRAAFPTTFKVPYDFTCEVYDKSNNLIPISIDPNSPNHLSKVISSGCICSALLTGSIWAGALGYGVSWKIAQIKIFPPRGVIPKGKCLVDDPDDEEEDDKDEKKKEDDDGQEEVIIEQSGPEVTTEEPPKPAPVVPPAPPTTSVPEVVAPVLKKLSAKK
uniref:Uncharacterized protein n=1 Tax=viral metagenome TaxID=1070528 RepID=A0A6C0BM65_9ZZZZ